MVLLIYAWLIDGSSFVRQAKRKAGYAVAATDKVLEALLLPEESVPQKAEITAWRRA